MTTTTDPRCQGCNGYTYGQECLKCKQDAAMVVAAAWCEHVLANATDGTVCVKCYEQFSEVDAEDDFLALPRPVATEVPGKWVPEGHDEAIRREERRNLAGLLRTRAKVMEGTFQLNDARRELLKMAKTLDAAAK